MVSVAEQPILDMGSHTNPDEGVCVMEWVSMVTNDRFTDFPACTDRYIARLAQEVNDCIGRNARQALHEFVPRLMRARRAVVTLDELLAEGDDPSVRLHQLIGLGRDRVYRNSWKPFWERPENARMLHIDLWTGADDEQLGSLIISPRPGETREQFIASQLDLLDRALTYHAELLAKEEADG